MCISASLNAIPCFCAIAWSNATRSFAYGIAYSITARERPVITAASAGARVVRAAGARRSRRRRRAAPSAGSSTRSSSSVRGRQRAQAELLLGLGDREARGVARHDERVEPAVVARDHEEVARAVGERHEALRAREHEALALRLGERARQQRLERGAGLDPGQRRRVEALAAEQRQERLAAARRCPDRSPRSRTRPARAPRRRASRRPRRAPRATIAFVIGERASPAPPYASGIAVDTSPSVCTWSRKLVGHLRRLVALARDRADRLLGELVHRVARELLLLRRFERDHESLLSRRRTAGSTWSTGRARPSGATWWK